MEPKDWKVGDTLVYEGSYTMGTTHIARETATQFVLVNGDRIRKGTNMPMGHDSYGCPHYYAITEPAGQRIYGRIVKQRKLGEIAKVKWNELPEEKLDAVLKILEEK